MTPRLSSCWVRLYRFPRLARFLWLAVLLTNLGLIAQSRLPRADLPEEVLALARIKSKMRQYLEQTTDYTCRQTIERSRIGAKAREKWKKKLQASGEAESRSTLPLDSTDKVQLEVAVVGGRELYSWPGTDKFEEKTISQIVGFGTLSSGDYAAHAQTVFVSPIATIRFAGAETLEGRRALWYEYEVPLFNSNYEVQDAEGSAVVAYHGSFRADAETYDLISMERSVDDTPAHLAISSISTEVAYALFAIGGMRMLLPQTVSMVTRFRSGAENYNHVHFTGCRAFQAESLLSFDQPSADLSSRLAYQDFELPAGLSLPFVLETGMDSEKSSVGDPIEARITSNVNHEGRLIVPKGAVVAGRIRRLDRFQEPRDYFILGIEWTEVRFGVRRARFQARLEHVAPLHGRIQRFGEDRTHTISSRSLSNLSGIQKTTVETDANAALPGTAEFYLQGKGFHIEPGLAMVWRTEAGVAQRTTEAAVPVP